MNVFVLNTGRCGSTTFIQACQHMTNFTAGHETRARCIGSRRLAYPPNHIEADNRLSWLLGRLEQQYGDDAFYVHLSREREATATSFAKRQKFGIMRAYAEGILMGGPQDLQADALARDYIDTVEANIALFLRHKPHKMRFRLEEAGTDFPRFWREVGAQGDLDSAMREWGRRYNASIQAPL